MANFLDLPLEIREQIYALLLVYSPPSPTPSPPPSSTFAGTHMRPTLTLTPIHPMFSHLHPAILAVNKQIHFEAFPILYTHNTFLAHPTLLASFPSFHADGRRPYPHISDTSCPGVRLIRRWYLKARLDCGPFWTAERVETAFSGADELTLEVSQSMYDGAGSEVLCLFEGVRGLKRVRVWGSVVGREEYVAWLEGQMREEV